MRIELRLDALLEDLGLKYFGVASDLAKACGVHRHTISALLNNTTNNPSLELLGNICRWILRKNKNIDPSILPGALFGSRPPELWRAFGKSDSVTIYLGEYRQAHAEKPNVPAHLSVSRRDVEVESMIIQMLSSTRIMGADRPSVHVRYIPFHYTWNTPNLSIREFQSDQERAIAVFNRDIRMRGTRESAIMLGSQRVNYLVECLVADLFDCEPFAPVPASTRIPFYLCYRDFDREVMSCFGGRDFPPRYKTWNRKDYRRACEAHKQKKGDKGDSLPAIPGTYYLLDKNGPWHYCPWVPEKEDAGIVITIRDAERVELAAWGFSGSATVAVGRHLIDYPEQFWPKTGEEESTPSPVTTMKRGKEIGIYLCKVQFPPNGKAKSVEEENDLSAKVEVIPLSMLN